MENHYYPELSDYQITQQIGKGTYGTVMKAVHVQSQKICAIKVIKLKNQGEYVSHRHIIMVAREIYILVKLTRMQHNTFTIKLFDIRVNQEAENDHSQLNTIFLVTNFETIDLNQLMKTNSEIDYAQARIIAYNMLISLNFIHSAGIIHRDLAPKNILINESCQVQFCDFGWSRTLHCDLDSNKQQRSLTPDISTRYYRAPENIIQSKDYDYKTDIWSYGTIVAELLRYCTSSKKKSNQPNTLWRGGSCYPTSPAPENPPTENVQFQSSDQLVLILQTLGYKNATMKSLTNKQQTYLDQVSMEVAQLSKKPLEKKLSGVPADLVDFVKQCLTFDPTERGSAKELFSHPTFKDIREPAFELEASRKISCAIDELKSKDYTDAKIKQFILKLVKSFK